MATAHTGAVDEFKTIDLQRLHEVAGAESDAEMQGKVSGWLDVADKGIGTLDRLSDVVAKFVVMAKPDFKGFPESMKARPA